MSATEHTADTHTNGHSNGHNGHDGHHGPPPPRTGWRRWTGPGWWRVLWMTPLIGFIGLGITCARSAGPQTGSRSGTPRRSSPSRRSRSRSASWPAYGAFDYWLYYSSGRKTRPEDHSGHGARSWRDYFRPNTDHKVIGVQYLVTTMIFFVIGGLFAMLFRAELAEPGTQYVNPQTFNVLILRTTRR